MFFFLSLYMQNVLDYSPPTHRPRLPPAHRRLHDRGRNRHAAAAPPRHQTRDNRWPLVAAAGVYSLSHAPVHGTFLNNLLPGIVIVAIGVGAVFTGVTEGVPADKARIASGLLNACMQFGGALGLAVLSAAATDRTNSVLDAGGNTSLALTAGFQRAFLIGAGLLLAAGLIASLATNTRAREHSARRQPVPKPDRGGCLNADGA